jgi:hypothetical protein
MHAMSSRPLVVNNGVYDSSGMGGSAVRSEYFHSFDSMIDEISGLEDEESLVDHPAYRFWFISPAFSSDDPPVFAGIDTWNGFVWTDSVTKGDLMEMYGSCGRDINVLTASLLHIPAN